MMLAGRTLSIFEFWVLALSVTLPHRTGAHWALRSEPVPPPLLLPRQMQFLGAVLVGQQIGLPQC